MLAPGACAPEVSLPDLDGAEWSLGEALRHGPVILVFFKVSCPACRFTFPYMQRLAEAKSGAQIFAISQDGVEDSREFQQRFGIYLRTLTDIPPAWPASNAFGITCVPSLFAIERDGESRGTIVAAFDNFDKTQLENIGSRFGAAPFFPAEEVPDFQQGCGSKNRSPRGVPLT